MAVSRGLFPNLRKVGKIFVVRTDDSFFAMCYLLIRPADSRCKGPEAGWYERINLRYVVSDQVTAGTGKEGKHD